VEISFVRDLADAQLDAVNGGGKQVGIVIAAPPPKEPEIPLLPGVLVGPS
jgi:hypothetical protein